jgi:glycosyltransferase involved in cell wall biosynthesis
MKIVFLNIYNGLVERGAERSTFELCNRLSKNHGVLLVQGGNNQNNDNDYKRIIIKPLFAHFSDSSLSILRKFYLDIWSLQILLFSLFSIFPILKFHPDVIVPVNGGWQSVICKILSIILKSKLLIVGRAGIGRDDHFNLLLKPDGFIALTNQAYEWANKISKKTKTKIFQIPNGINLTVFQPKGGKYKSGLKKPIVLCVSSLMPNKRIDLVIKAVSLLKNVSLLIVGKGNDRHKLQNLGEKLLGQDRFRIISVSFDDMPKVYREADIFTMVSKEGEAFGNVYLEAIACGLPVVATNDKTRKEILLDYAVFIDADDSVKFAGLLDKVIIDSDSKKHMDWIKKYSWDQIIILYEKVLNQI